MNRVKKNSTLENPEEIELGLHEIVTLASHGQLSSAFGTNGSRQKYNIKRIRPLLTGTYDNESGELRCEFNTKGIQDIVGEEYDVYTKPRATPMGLRYFLFIELKQEGTKNA